MNLHYSLVLMSFPLQLSILVFTVFTVLKDFLFFFFSFCNYDSLWPVKLLRRPGECCFSRHRTQYLIMRLPF